LGGGSGAPFRTCITLVRLVLTRDRRRFAPAGCPVGRTCSRSCCCSSCP